MDEAEFGGSINKFKTDITTNNNNKKQNRQIRWYVNDWFTNIVKWMVFNWSVSVSQSV